MVEVGLYKLIGDITQLVRVSASHAGSPRFESEYPHFLHLPARIVFGPSRFFCRPLRNSDGGAKSLARVIKKG